MSKYRLYALDVRGVVHEDEFEEYDNSQPYYDDYFEFEVSDTDDLGVILSEIVKFDISRDQVMKIIDHFVWLNW